MIPLLGHSGCSVVRNGDTVRKTCADQDRAPRLAMQAQKQRVFKDPFIKAPKVLEEAADGFLMEYIPGTHPFAAAFPMTTVKRLTSFVLRNVAEARMVHVEAPLFTAKLEELGTRLDTNPRLGGTEALEPVLEDLAEHFARGATLPIGYCHGDLTFCNAIVQRSGEIYLVDFLDSFVSTPLADMVKLRQDTAHQWIRLFDPLVEKRDLAEADYYLREQFKAHEFYRKHYDAFALLSLLRILPYATDARVVAHVLEEIKHAHASTNLRG